ncbi:MAG: family 20 glycosylhydrolase [Candidatus Aminicenantes bacterium]|nr:family 20 glycosylhydrolase [Candidatus Aminicenantes bacterium]
MFVLGTALALAPFLKYASYAAAQAPAPADRDAVLNIIPRPWNTEFHPGRFVFSRDTVVVLEDHWTETAPVAAYLAENLVWGSGGGLKIGETRSLPGGAAGAAIRLSLRAKKPDLGAEGYILKVLPGEIRLEANAAAGLFYGVQTLRQALRIEHDGTLALPCLTVTDRPRFGWRGMLLDCGRHFMSKEFVKRYIDLLAVHKMNRFHWHLTEDQGWRIEIKKYPLLTEIGAWRTDDAGNRYGGFYTQDDIREVVAYARSRFVTVVPEIEMPGHSVAALAAYPELSCTGGPFDVPTLWGVYKDVYCAGNDRTFAFLEDVLSEVIGLFPGPYIHIGGDEAPKDRWNACPKCQARMRAEGLKDESELQSYFIRRIERFLSSEGRILIGWDEILEGGLAPNAVVQSWRSFDGALAAARSGHDAVVSPVSHAYFDYDLSRTDLRRVYAFEPVPPGLTIEESRHILGGECNMWTEYAPQETIDGKMFPRILAMAEVLWSRAGDRDFQDFRSRLRAHRPRLEALGVRVGEEARPLSIATSFQAESDRLTAAVQSREPGLEIRYTFDGTQPTLRSPVYREPVEITGSCRLKAAAFLEGRPYGRVEEREFVGHRGRGGRVALSPSFSSRYPAAGLSSLADGVRGAPDHLDGAWQGFEGTDVEITVDLGQVLHVRRLSCGFLQHASVAVTIPDQVEFFVSTDGRTFRHAGTAWPRVPRKTADRLIRDVSVDLESVKARHVRVRARNAGPCPAGHPLAGIKTWIFADEVVVD